MHVTVDLLRTDEGHLEGMVTTASGSEHPFSGTLGLLRILEDLEPVRQGHEPGPQPHPADRRPGDRR